MIECKIPEAILAVMRVTHCTVCGKKFEKGDGGKYPYPEEHVLCKECFAPALGTGIEQLNKVLKEGKMKRASTVKGI